MASGGQKRTRSERVAALDIRPGNWERAWTQLKQREVMLRFGLCLFGSVALAVLTRSWDPPFHYRKGAILTRDVTARVPFTMVNVEETRLAREKARWQARYVYANDASSLVQLRAALRNAVAEVMRAQDYSQVKHDVWADFEPHASVPLPQTMKKRYDLLRATYAADEKLEGFQRSLAEAMRPFEERGLLNKLQQEPGQGNQDEIVVYPKGHPESQLVVRCSEALIGNGTAIRESLRQQIKPQEVADMMFDWIQPRLGDTLKLDPLETRKALDMAANSVPEVVVHFEPGQQKLAIAGQPLGDAEISLLGLEHQAALDRRTIWQRVMRTSLAAGFNLAMFGLCGLYLLDRQRRILVSLRRLTTLLVLVLITATMGRILGEWPAGGSWRAEIIPLLILGETLSIAYSRELAMLISGLVTLILALALGLKLGATMVLFGVTASAILQLKRIRNRSKLIYVSFWSALVAFATSFAVTALDNQPDRLEMFTPSLIDGLYTAAWTVAAGFLMTGLLPFIESFFGVLTDISLLELGDAAHPLLQEMVRRAPATYNHSITVGSIAEAAAESIGARGLLVRVGAYFHDIGKMLKPEYFIENQSNKGNRHESLIPAMSTLVIIAHIKDGADLARQHKLPEPIIDFIEQHHGTTLVEYFYKQANAQSQQDPNGAEVEESAFRYPGPRPQTKEAAVMMLADAAESACRSLVDPAPSRIESLVREVAERKLDDGQFDESNLTLRELRTIEDSIIKTLIANYHGRVKYPDQKTA
jgi:putative nucleotidyltransferase with HDIG domain